MQILKLWNDYTREDVHGIFSPGTVFTPQAGTWGLQGMVRIPERRGDWVFFVTFGQEQGDHVFDESVTDDGVLSWQSQPSQRLVDETIRQLISHDDRQNNIHLFLRAKTRLPYSYMGTLGYLTHDALREKPVHFQWQLLNWPSPDEFTARLGIGLVATKSAHPTVGNGLPVDQVTFVDRPSAPTQKTGVSTQDFKKRKSPNYALRDERNRQLGLKGELLVITHEKARLIAANRQDLANQVVHVSIVEGDSAGYDVRSFEIDGNVRHLEVKVTEGGSNTDFFMSPNELSFSEKNAATYSLYRLYEFNAETNSAKSFVLKGNVLLELVLIPTAFRARLAPENT